MPHPANTPNTLIEVPTFCENLKSAETFLSTNWAVLLQGESSSGKTILSSELARRHNASLKAINVDDNFDSKDLLGKFSATDVPGVFEWVAGPITSAVKDGTWVLMEDVDLASFDVFSVLLPLIITGKLFVADKGVTLDAHPNFRLIATQQISLVGKNKILTQRDTVHPNAEAWPTVIVETPTTEEKLTIIKTVFPYTPDVPLQQLLLNIPVHQCGLRDMLKWAKRVSVHITPGNFRTAADFWRVS